AREKHLASFRVVDIRDFTHDRHRTVDDKPFGGGPGMVMKPGPVFEAVEATEAASDTPATRVLLTPQGERLTHDLAVELAAVPRLLLICGHYEGYDERIRLGLAPREVSIGDYVLTGGELPAMVLIDAVVRLIPGVLGAEASLDEESFADGMLEYPHYTRPRVYRDMAVPEVLLSGDHEEIDRWRREQSLRRTRERRGES
ncbi:MAG TPA: tRNA (guanosine(37)-N1)-methyltransferase TrmD, partial [Planctomycetota bacterium]|nr:tRNA (guanosine(37)-N1)-methyltransferase TrmD [Planctomycetota bacterium]